MRIYIYSGEKEFTYKRASKISDSQKDRKIKIEYIPRDSHFSKESVHEYGDIDELEIEF